MIGGGAMGSAFAKGVIGAGVYKPGEVTIADVDADRLKQLTKELGATAAPDNKAAASGADVILIAVKPGYVKQVLGEIAGGLSRDQLIVSIAAGVKLDTITSCLPKGAPVVRAMPNTPCRIGAGATGFCCGEAVNQSQVQAAKRIFDAVGVAHQVPEQLINAVTGLSGSGPAYVYLIIEALSDAGVRVGLPRNIALDLAAQTVLGAARMVVEEKDHPARLKDQVTSPGGTTIAGIDALEHAGIRSALIEAVKAAANRADELG
ncbi:MAG: pyrroline-5-carboxylate reductase [Armatimonadetes bacterium RBG_16_58_9]|nr:MAG: pyrroline-5-carboxylate reductase [Armatimonadetes bacterium RBG_16_58_9]